MVALSDEFMNEPKDQAAQTERIAFADGLIEIAQAVKALEKAAAKHGMYGLAGRCLEIEEAMKGTAELLKVDCLAAKILA